MRRSVLWAIAATGLLAVAGCLILSAQSSSPSIITTKWKATPLVVSLDPAPGTGGSFQEFGEHAYVGSGVVVFWARYDNKHWALYSVADGPPKLIAKHLDVFDTPDGGKHRSIARAARGTIVDQPATPAVAGRRLYYFEPAIAGFESPVVYGWDGKQILRVLGPGDPIAVADGRDAVVDKVLLTNSTSDGRAVFWVKTRKPAPVQAWFVHDGTTLKPLFMVGAPLRPITDATINVLQGGPEFSSLFIDPLTLDDGTLVVLNVEHAPFKQALFRMTDAGFEKLLASNDPDPGSPKDQVGNISKVAATDGSHIVVVAGGTYQQKVLLYSDGHWKNVLSDVKQLPALKGFRGYQIAAVAAAEPQSGRFVLSIVRSQSDAPSPDLQFATTHLFTLAGNQLTLVPGAFPLRVRQLPLHLGVGVETPLSVLMGGSPYLAPGQAAFVPAAKLNVDGIPLFVTGVLGSPAPDRLVVYFGSAPSIEGYYALTQIGAS